MTGCAVGAAPLSRSSWLSSSKVSSSASPRMCETSISMPSRYIARTAASPSSVRPAPAFWGKRRVVERVGQERERRRVGGDAAPEQVGERDVGDAARGERDDVRVDVGRRGAEVEAALDAVDEADDAVGEGAVELGLVVDTVAPGCAADLRLDLLELLEQAGEVARLRQRAVGLVEVHLVERRVEHRQPHAHAAGGEEVGGHARPRVPAAVVQQPARDPQDRAAGLVAGALAAAHAHHPPERDVAVAREHVHRVVHVEVRDQGGASSALTAAGGSRARRACRPRGPAGRAARGRGSTRRR